MKQELNVLGNKPTWHKIPNLAGKLNKEARLEAKRDALKAKRGGKEKEKVKDSKDTEQETPETPGKIILPSEDLQFVEDENMYNEIVKYLDAEFPDHQDVLSGELIYADKVMKGSNTYIAVGVDMFLKAEMPESECRIINQSDLETNLNMFKNIYVDSGLALRNLENANKKQAKYLFNQLKKKGIKKSDFPIWINLRGLSLDNDLNFNLTDESLYETAECLNWQSGTKYSKKDEFGLPKEVDENSSREIWTSNHALSRCYLWNSLLSSYSSDLLCSIGSDRVVVANAKGASHLKNSGGNRK